MQNTLLLHYFRSYSPNVLCEIHKSQLLHILTVLEKRPANVLKTSRKDFRSVTSSGRPQDVKFEPLVKMHFHCIIFNFVLPNLYLKH